MYPSRLLLLPLLLLPAASEAQTQNFYLGVYGDRQSLGVANSEFTTAVGMLSVGYWIKEGIGLELEAGTGLSEDSINTLDASVESMVALNIRLESPPVNDVAAYFLIGASATRLDSNFSDAVNSDESSSFSGVRAAIGLTLKVTPRWQADIAFTHHEYGGDIGINSLRVGMRLILAPAGLGGIR